MADLRNSRLRILHTSPDAPPLDVLIDGAPFVTGLRYTQLSPYGELPPGRPHLQVFPSAARGRIAPAVDHKLAELQPAEGYTVAIAGEEKDLHALQVLDRPPAPAPDQVAVRILHASSDAPAVDVSFRGLGVLFDQVAFERVTRFRQVPPATYNVEVRPHGGVLIYAALADYTLVAGRTYTFALLGLLREPPALMLLPIVDPVRECVPVSTLG